MYSAKIEGEPTTFGTSGLLYRSNKLMYDRTTGTLWSQLLGEPVIGPLADSGIRLRVLPVELTTWGEWLSQHPDTTVLSIDTGVYPLDAYRPEEDARSIYFDYRLSTETMFPVWNRDDRLATKQSVLALSVGDVHKAYPVDVLRGERVINDRVGDTDVILLGSPISSAGRAYASEGLRFALPDDSSGTLGLPDTLVDADGVEWRVTEGALVSSVDPTQTLGRLASHISFWFAWFAFHPDTQVYEARDGD